jgi:hypothetical protein
MQSGPSPVLRMNTVDPVAHEDVQFTHLQRDEPDTLDVIADEHKVLEYPNGGDVEVHIEEREPHESLIKVKALDIHLQPGEPQVRMRTMMRGHPMPTPL